MTTTTAPAQPRTVMSADGTPIASWVAGSGPAIVLIDAALSLHAQSAKLAALLAPRFTVTTYDRRGRGESGDARPDRADVANEVADIEALVDAAGGSALLFGSSSGAALALEAATRLGDTVTGLFLYEPPFIVDGSRPALAADLPARIASLVAAGKRGAAQSAFMREAMGIPSPAVVLMHLMPTWGQGSRLAHTLRYDFAVLAGTQDGVALPAKRWSGLRAPGVVMVGSRSEPFFHSGAQALAAALPGLDYVSLEGGHHGSAVMAPQGIAEAITARFAGHPS
jgi:pimeloyl-ACP methyl ester carboxylesterase